MTLYLDTSLVVTALSPEPETANVQHWLRSREAEGFAVSDWVVTEFSAALSLKLRMDKIRVEERTLALSRFAHLAARSFESIPIVAQDFRTAAILADNSRAGLRAGDALHLAIARRAFATICTRDKGLAAAAAIFGVPNVLL